MATHTHICSDRIYVHIILLTMLLFFVCYSNFFWFRCIFLTDGYLDGLQRRFGIRCSALGIRLSWRSARRLLRFAKPCYRFSCKINRTNIACRTIDNEMNWGSQENATKHTHFTYTKYTWSPFVSSCLSVKTWIVVLDAVRCNAIRIGPSFLHFWLFLSSLTYHLLSILYVVVFYFVFCIFLLVFSVRTEIFPFRQCILIPELSFRCWVAVADFFFLFSCRFFSMRHIFKSFNK